MSKQEKLTKLLFKVRKFCQDRNGKCLDGLGVIDAYAEFCKEMDDPPQPPEMPEVVRDLLARLWTESFECDFLDLAKAVEAHYAQPLKLEVGKVYVDGHEGPVQIVWKSPSPNGYRWLGVVVTNGETRWFNDDGKPPCQTPEFKLIREVTQ